MCNVQFLGIEYELVFIIKYDLVLSIKKTWI